MTETRTMTLVEFLEARLAEDERRVYDWHIEGCGSFRMYDDDPGAYGMCDCAAEKRLRREIAAKRAIIEQAAVATEWDEAVESEWGGTGKPDPGDTILCALASVYADYPDYRSEWAL